MDDLQIIELYFAHDEQAVKATDDKYGKWFTKRIDDFAIRAGF